MAAPSDKSPDVERKLNKMTNRTQAIKANACISEPVGCGQAAKSFRDALSAKEYTISGLCQSCQDRIFG